jgi:lipopolysaccharide transport system ATP-binding protein
MRLGILTNAEAALLSAGDGIVAEGLAKAYHDVAERAFEAPTPVLTRAFRGRRPRGLREATIQHDDDDSMSDDSSMDDDEEDNQEEVVSEEDEREPAVWALRDASFRIPLGSCAGLVGGSRSGKTTLLKVLAGATPPTLGRAVLAGRPSPLINLSVQLMVQTLAPETNVGFAGAIAGMGKRGIRPHLEAIFELAQVSARERRVGVTMNPYKIAVASAIELGADVLLLDDPFASASGSFRDAVIEAIERRRSEGATVVIETRDRDILRRLCDMAILLDQGVVVRTGPVVEMLAAHDASAAAARAAAPVIDATTGFNETAAVVSGSGEANSDGSVSIVLRLEIARTAVTIQTGVGLIRDDGVGLWFEQPDPVICELPGFHRFQVVAHDVPPGRYRGLLQGRVLEAGEESVIVRRDAFEVVVGAPSGNAGPSSSEIAWERRDASWLYEPEPPRI